MLYPTELRAGKPLTFFNIITLYSCCQLILGLTVIPLFDLSKDVRIYLIEL